MRIGAFIRTLGFQLAVAMSLLIVAVGAYGVWQIDSLLRQSEYDHFADHLARAERQLAQQIETDRALVVTGAVVLAGQPVMQDAVTDGDVVAVLQIATDYYNRTGTTLQGGAGLQVYDARGNLLVRAHDPLRGRQQDIPAAVSAVISTGSSLGVIRHDERLGLTISGVSAVVGADGEVLGAVETMVAIDGPYLMSRERLLNVDVALVTDGHVVTGDETLVVSSEDAAALPRGEASDETPLRVSLGGAPYLATALPITSFAGDDLGSLYLVVQEAEILSHVNEVRAVTLQVTGVGVLIALTLASGLAFIAVRPIRELVFAARRLQANDLDTPIVTNGPKEVVDLAAALDDLRVAVRQTREAMLSVNRDIALRFEASAESLSDVSQELAAMHSILGALSIDSPEGLAGVTEHLTELGWVDGALVAVADETGHLSVASSFGLTPAAGAVLLRTIEEGLDGQQLESGVMSLNTATMPEAASLVGHGIGGFAGEPVIEPDGIAGVIAITSRGTLQLTESRAELLRAVAREIALTLERTELAGAVEENRRIAESVLREMSDGVLVIDHEGRCLVANPAAERLLGVPRAELLGSLDRDILPLSENALLALKRRAAGTPVTPVAPLLAEGNGRHLAISTGPFIDADPAATGMMVLLRDLSMETEAERVKQDFVSMVGHELRTPLTLIRTTVDLLNEGDAGVLNPTQERVVEVLRSNTDRLMSLINDLLDMSAIDSGRMTIQPEETELVEVITSAIEDARPAAEAKEHRLSSRLPDEVTVWADRRRVGQMVANLIGNAVKYTPAGGTIEVAVEVIAPWVHVRVRDNGIGIDPDEQDRLFERFYRTTAGRRISGGTGLGLAITRSLVDLHGGRIWVESDGESGSTFIFTLPMRPI